MKSAQPTLILLAGILLLAQVTHAQDGSPKFEVGPVLGAFHENRMLGAGSSSHDTFLLGGRFSFNWLTHLSLDAESTVTPDSQGLQFIGGGRITEALFGVKSGLHVGRLGLFAKFRPGLIHYTNATLAVTSTSPPTLKILNVGRTNPAYDLGGGAEFELTPRWLIRYDFSDLIVQRGATTEMLITGGTFTIPGATIGGFQFTTSLAYRF